MRILLLCVCVCCALSLAAQRLEVIQPDVVRMTVGGQGRDSVKTSDFVIVFDGTEATIYKSGIILTRVWREGTSLVFAVNPTEAFYGGGSKGINLNKRGMMLQNYNQAHFDYQFGQTDLNISIPFLVSNRGYGWYIDDPEKGMFDVAKSNPGEVRYSGYSDTPHCYFIGGGSLDNVVSNFTALTGRQPLPPRWALGYISSRYSYKSEREAMDIVQKTRAAGIPLDGLVFDLNWYKDATLMGNHNWYRDSFPDPSRMLANLARDNVKVVPISETYITRKSENYGYAVSHHLLATDSISQGRAHIFDSFWAAPAALLDIFNPAAQAFYWSLYKQRIREGVSGWWFDLGEPESSTDSLIFAAGSDRQVHNLYALTWARTVFDGYRKDFPDRRVFTLIRSGYAGMQRYSVFPWSGDIDRSFQGLKAQIPIMLNMGLGGVGYMHSDAGGFTGNPKKDPELYSRWLEFAAFTPVMRTHADATEYTPEPIYWDDATRKRVTRFIRLRYALLPYNYTLAYTNTMTGRPLMMPVNYFEEANPRLADINDEYLWGEHMLVAPVIVKGDTVKKVLFPGGTWIGFSDHRVYRDSAVVSAGIDSLPLFVKDGSVIPEVGSMTSTEGYKGEWLILRYFTGGDAPSVVSTWFYDDGKDPRSLDSGKYDLVTITTQTVQGFHAISMRANHLFRTPKYFKFIVPGKVIRRFTFSIPITQVGEDGFMWDGSAVEFALTAR
jgi:oligosaccharide 4-alpha-D-glucosyltransferase